MLCKRSSCLEACGFEVRLKCAPSSRGVQMFRLRPLPKNIRVCIVPRESNLFLQKLIRSNMMTCNSRCQYTALGTKTTVARSNLHPTFFIRLHIIFFSRNQFYAVMCAPTMNSFNFAVQYNHVMDPTSSM